MTATTQLHHRQTAPQHFTNSRITSQVCAILKSARKSIAVSNHAKDKYERYLWQPRTNSVTKNGREFPISRLDYTSLRFSTSFSALLASAQETNIFEIVLNTDYEVTKLALRVDLPTSPDTDIILVLAGELETDRLEYQSVRLVTWYLNHKNDNHSTLQKERYAS
jgi:hypothetical protein